VSPAKAGGNRSGRGNCAACESPARDQLDIDCAAGGESQRSIAKRHGLSEAALRAHRRNHRNNAIVALTASRLSTVDQVASGMDGGLSALLARTEQFLVIAEQTGNHPAAMSAIANMRAIWELWGRATGALKERPPVVFNLVQSPEWQALATELFTVLQEHPDALAAVRAQLRLDPPDHDDDPNDE
jgi:hypothetical protein